MLKDIVKLQDLDDLRQYVHKTICHQNELEFDVFQITERMLTRGGRPCGILFCLHGPRSVKLTAIWETDHNTILFYGSSGERRLKIELAGSTRLKLAAA